METPYRCYEELFITATTARCSPAGSTSPASRWRCCSTRSAGRTASPTGSPRSTPPLTGKIERLHQTLQRELLDVHGPFDSIEALQAGVDTWREESTTDRPHQSLGMAFPASRFTPASSPLELRIPAQLSASMGQPKPPPPATGPLPAPSLPAEMAPMPGTAAGAGQPAVEVDRVVPASGHVWIGGQQVWLGPALSGRPITFWADAIRLHVLLGGTRIKTLPSRLGAAQLARLATAGARPAGPSPLPTGNGAVIEGDRTGNATGRVAPGPPAHRTRASAWPAPA